MIKKLVGDFRVLQNTQLNSNNYLLKLSAPDILPIIEPGQFVNVDIKNCREIFLRRPFSVFDADQKENSLSIIVKVLGRGSKKLTEIKPGDKLNLIYPLGKGFTYPSKNEKIILIGGGSGIAPILFLAKKCRLPAENVDIIIGARYFGDHVDMKEHSKYGKLHYTTDDGSIGFKGLVTMHPLIVEKLNSYDKIYACGPKKMMEAVARKAKKENIFCEVSLENLMACGFGVCLCCIEPTVKGNVRVCSEGPVFNINDLKWQI
jgi:dihydroorotate dehydrogenase electron transfer subunit